MTETFELTHDEGPSSADNNDAAGVVAAVAALDTDWATGTLLTFDGVPWRPDLWNATKSRALYVHLSGVMPRYIMRRLHAAKSSGVRVHVALRMEALYEPAIVEVLAEVDAMVYVFDSLADIGKPKHVLAAIADHTVPVSPETRLNAARSSLALIDAGTSHEKGARLEALLAFLLSQTSDFRVIERNFRNETQEIDIVVQIDNYSARCWVTPGVPFLLVEAKNRQQTAGQPEVSILIRKLQTKRKRSNIGLLFSIGGITSDARSEELRSSESEICVAMFDLDDLTAWIESSGPDDFLEAHVRRALLR